VLASLQDDGTTTQVQTLDVASGEVRGQFVLGDEDLVPVLSPDGDLTVTTSFQGTTAIRSTTDGTTVAQVPVTRAFAAAFDPDEHRVLVGGETGQAGVYDVATGRLLTQLEGHDPSWEVFGAAFSPDGSRVATASADDTVRVWDADSGKQLLSVTAFGAHPHMYEQHAAVSFSPDGKHLVTGAGFETDANLWDASTGDHLATLEGNKSDLTDLVFSADGRFLVTAYLSNAARLWDGRSGRLLSAVTDPAVPAYAAAFVDSSRIALVESPDSGPSLAVLDCSVCGDLDSLVALARTRVTRELTDTEKATYLTGD
jgi:WD40 repeat protein